MNNGQRAAGAGAKNAVVGSLLLHAVLAGGALLVLLPFLWLACAAFKRQQDIFSVPLLPWGRLGDLTSLWNLDIDPSAVCAAYGDALEAEAATIVKTRSDYINAAIDLYQAIGGSAQTSAMARAGRRL